MTDYTYFVSGKVYARLAGGEAPFEWPGLVDTIGLSVSENVISLPDRTQPGGGVYKQIRRIESMSITINHRELNADTLARALFGEGTRVPGGTESDEQHIAYPGGFIPLAHPGSYTNVSVTTDETSPQPISSDNYEVVPGGIQILEDAPDIDTMGTGIQVTYTYPDYHRIQGLTGSPPELEIVFMGRNEARDDKEVRVRIYRVRLGAVQDLQLLSADDFGQLSLTGEVLKDSSITGQGLSQYLKVDIVP